MTHWQYDPPVHLVAGCLTRSTSVAERGVARSDLHAPALVVVRAARKWGSGHPDGGIRLILEICPRSTISTPFMSGKRRNDRQIVEHAQQGDDEAFALLLTRIEPMLRSFFISRIGARSEVDDLVQNTFLRLHRGLPELRDNTRLKSFTMRAAIFELQDYYRGRYGPKEYLFDPDSFQDHADYEEDAGVAVDLNRAFQALSDKARTIMQLREYGFRYEEIARKLDTTEAAVKMQVKRAFEKMREALGAHKP